MKDLVRELFLYTYLTNLDFEKSKKLVKSYFYKYSSDLESEVINAQFDKFFYALDGKIEIETKPSYEQFRSCIENNFYEIKDKLDLSIWFNYFQVSNFSERKTFILSQILNKSDEKVAELMGITTGTVRYRLSESYDKISKVNNYA